MHAQMAPSTGMSLCAWLCPPRPAPHAVFQRWVSGFACSTDGACMAVPRPRSLRSVPGCIAGGQYEYAHE